MFLAIKALKKVENSAVDAYKDEEEMNRCGEARDVLQSIADAFPDEQIYAEITRINRAADAGESLYDLLRADDHNNQ